MIIDRITLNNYRLYKGCNSITFNHKAGTNVFLISGENGFGKTTFLHSLLWCLYGRLASDIQDHLKKEILNGGYSSLLKNNLNHLQKNYIDDLSQDVISQIKKYGYVGSFSEITNHSQYYVEILFSDLVIPSIPCKSVCIRRTYDYILDKEYIEILIDGKKNELTNEIGPEIFINDFILNKDIARFFFFDSEQIVSLAETNLPSDRKKLGSAYNEVLGVRKYEDLRTSLNSVRVRFRKRSNDAAMRLKIEDLMVRKTSIESEINELQQTVFNIDSKIDSLKSQNEELQLRLIREGNGATTEEISRLNLLLKTCSTKDTEYKTLLKTFLEYAPLAILGKLWYDTRKQIEIDYKVSASQNILREQNNFVSDITSDLILMLHKLSIEASLKMELEQKVQSVLDNYRSKQIEHRVQLDVNDQDYKEFLSIYNYITSTFRAEFERLADDYKKNKQVLDRTSRRLLMIDSKERDSLIAALRKEKNRIESNINKYDIEIRYLHSKIGEKKIILANIQKQLSELMKNTDLEDLDGKKDSLAQTLCNEISDFLHILKEEKKLSLENRIRVILNNLMHKDEFVSSVNVKIMDEDMDIELYRKDGTIINKDSLSKGEQQLYASSLLKALVEESGIKFPVFIDSPLQKFDKSHASKIITDFYPSISSQVVLFPLLHKELTQDELEIMKPMVNSCHIIKNNVSSSYFEETNIDSLLKGGEHV